MTTGDEEAEDLVDNLLSDVDDQFNDLEREYSQARVDLVSAHGDRSETPVDPLEASNERYALLSQVASLKADIARQADELDERDRMLAELGDRIAGFEAEIAKADDVATELHQSQQLVLEARREQNRQSALLDARAAEREELAEVVDRLQNERDNVQDLLTTALARFDEAEASRTQMDDKLRHLEAAQETSVHEHEARAHELIESRAEVSRLTDKLADAVRSAEEAAHSAERAEALTERRANEANYLNRRIDAMTEKLADADGLGDQVSELRKTIASNERRHTELEREIASQRSETAAANAAVDAIAERTSDYEELVHEIASLEGKIATLEKERDAAWAAASGRGDSYSAVADDSPTEDALADKARELIDRARELGSRRSVEAEAAAQAAEEAAAAAAAAAPAAPSAPQPVASVAVDAETDDPAESELLGLDDVDTTVIDNDLADLLPAGEVEAVEHLPPPPAPPGELPDIESIPRVSLDHLHTEADNAGQTEIERTPTGEIPQIAIPELPTAIPPKVEVPQVAVPQVEAPQVEFPGVVVPMVAAPEPPAPVAALPEPDVASTTPVPELAPMSVGGRKRAILPTNLVPNTPEAVAHLLNQPGVTAIVDARSTCGRTGIRPSELFEHVVTLRDHFDVPVEVVVTPVSTPVGGAPDLPAIGVHHVTGADTVADRVRAICMGFPADQPLVVIAGDDHVRRAAIGEEANVVEPAAVLDVATS